MYALITGASSGIGKELAILLAEKGYDLILVARRKDRLMELKEKLEKKDVKVLVETFDLSILENCDGLFEKIKELDVKLFINNAGYGKLGMFYEADLQAELNMIDLNIKSLHILTKLYIKHFNEGLIVNVGSIAGFLPTPKMATYAATKAYVNSFSRAVNYELMRNNKQIRVLNVTPGPVVTEFSDVANAKHNRGMDAKKCALEIVRGIEKKKALIVPGASMKFLRFLIRFVPTRLLLKSAYRIQDSK